MLRLPVPPDSTIAYIIMLFFHFCGMQQFCYFCAESVACWSRGSRSVNDMTQMIKSFYISEGSLDSARDLTIMMFIWGEMEEVVRKIMEDTRFKGHQHWRFEIKVDADDGERLCVCVCGVSAGVAFQIGHKRYVP